MRLRLMLAIFAIFVSCLPISAVAQKSSDLPAPSPPRPRGFRETDPAEQKKSKELNDRFVKALTEGRWDDAIAAATELLNLARRLFGPNHFHVVSNAWRVQEVQKIKTMSKDDLAILRAISGLNREALRLESEGRYEEAQSFWERALANASKIWGDEHPETARCYWGLAHNLSIRGQFAASQSLVEKAVDLYRRYLGEEHPETLAAYGSLAGNLTAQGRHEAAEVLHRKELESYLRLLGENNLMTAATYTNLAANLSALNKKKAAQALLEKALGIERQILGDRHISVAKCYQNLAVILGEQGKYVEAQALCEKAILIKRQALGEEHPEIASAYSTLAIDLLAQGKCGAAEQFSRKAVAIRNRHPNDDPFGAVTSLHGLALSLKAQGKLKEARDVWIRAAKSFELGRLASAHTGLGRATASAKSVPLRLLVTLLARLEQYSEAWQQLEEALARGLLDELAARSDTRLSDQERTRLSQLLGELQRFDRALEASRQRPIEAAQKKQLDAMRSARYQTLVALDEFRSFLASKYGPISGRVASLADLQSVLADDAAVVTWVDVERGNGAIDFGDHWGVVVRARGIPRWFHLEGTGTGGRWTDEDIRLGALARNSLIRRPLSVGMVPETLLRRLRSQRLDPLAGAFKASVDGLRPVHKIIVLPSDLMMGVPIEALASPEDGWIISYAPSATIFAQLTRLPKAEAPGGLLALGNPRFEPPIVSSNHAPLPDHGLLAATVVPGGNASRHGLKARDVVTAYNDTVLHGYDDLKIATTGDKAIPIKVWRDGEISERGVDPGELGVVFDPRPASVAVLDTRRLDAVLLAASTRSERLEGLPGTRYEIEALGRTFAAARRPFRILSDDNASEQNIDQIAASSDLSRFAFIHLATHALIDEINPDRSAVILAQTGLPDPLVQVLNKKTVYDGKLTTREIEHDWNLKAELVTLSACETANGKFVSGEGFVGFTQSLLISGARSVCLSLWKVDDAATALLMERFYANLLAARPGLSMPLPKAEALAEAKSWLRALHRDEIAELAANLSGGDARSKDAPRRKPAPPANSAPPGLDENHPYAHPYYWSAFVLVGNPD